MKIVSLVSGGLDSAVMAALLRERGSEQFPLFVDYGQLSGGREWESCCRIFEQLNLPEPNRLNLVGYGEFYSSGITDSSRDVFSDAFLPGRNALFLLAGAAHAIRLGANAIGIGLLDDRSSYFPDQTRRFVGEAEKFLSVSFGAHMYVLAPLMQFTKSDVYVLSQELGISGTYSCHSGGDIPCGMCISCKEFRFLEE